MTSDTISRRDLAAADLSDTVSGEHLAPVTPGEVLRTEFLEPMGISARALARDLNFPANRITEILNGDRAITADTAVMLALRFGTSQHFWINLQVAHDLEIARERSKASLLRQLEMLHDGTLRTGENTGRGETDTTQATIERLERWVKELDAVA
jgi:addiction module HigA family antidote